MHQPCLWLQFLPWQPPCQDFCLPVLLPLGPAQWPLPLFFSSSFLPSWVFSSMRIN